MSFDQTYDIYWIQSEFLCNWIAAPMSQYYSITFLIIRPYQIWKRCWFAFKSIGFSFHVLNSISIHFSVYWFEIISHVQPVQTTNFVTQRFGSAWLLLYWWDITYLISRAIILCGKWLICSAKIASDEFSLPPFLSSHRCVNLFRKWSFWAVFRSKIIISTRRIKQSE